MKSNSNVPENVQPNDFNKCFRNYLDHGTIPKGNAAASWQIFERLLQRFEGSQ